MDSPLPYRDTKPQGAADFYFAINATFDFVRRQYGAEGLVRYWEDLGRNYMLPVWQRWRRLGAEGIATYWRAFFDAEPGSEVEVIQEEAQVRLEVRRCPAIAHLRKHGRTIGADFCRHCYHISHAAAQQAGYAMRLKGGNGSCTQTFFPATGAEAPQDLNAITPC